MNATHFRLVLGSVLFVAVTAFAVPKPRVTVTCAGVSGAIYGLVQVADATSAYPADDTNDVSVVIGKPATTPTLTLGSSGCRTTNGSTTDSNYSATSDYYKGGMHILLSANNSQDARIPQAVWLPSSTPNPGVKYTGLQQLTYNSVYTTPCAEGSDYFYRTCLLP